MKNITLTLGFALSSAPFSVKDLFQILPLRRYIVMPRLYIEISLKDSDHFLF
jgi:hypothetical protein